MNATNSPSLGTVGGLRLRLRLIDPSWLVIVGAPFVYWLRSLAYSGPVFLTDEIGYLSNAAFLAGHRLDAASSYHAGYSLFLAPLFAVLSDPAAIWRGVMTVNAFFWVLTWLLLSRLLSIYFPGSSVRARAGALLVCSIYPAWITMAGYALTTSALACVILCSLLAFARWRPGGAVTSLLPHTLCVGLLYWIHPTGLAAVFASLTIVGLLCWKMRDFLPLGLHACVLALMVLGYDIGFHPWMVAAMTPMGYPPQTHYGSITEFLAAAPVWPTAGRSVVLFLGHSAYLVVGSFGLVALGAFHCVSRARSILLPRVRAGADAADRVALLSLLATVFVLAIGALSHAPNPSRVDQWLYGRYSDPFGLSLIAFGALVPFTASRRDRLAIAAVGAAALLLIGIAIGVLVPPGAINAIQSTPAFWPQYVIRTGGVLRWLSLGALATVVVVVGGRRLAMALLLPSFLLSSWAQFVFHSSILARDAHPSALVDIVRLNFAPGTCIGYYRVGITDTSDFRTQRFQLYQFSFFDYAYRRMNPEEWFSGCNGPLLTRDAKQFEDDSRVAIIAREDYSGLLLMVKTAGAKPVIPSSVSQADDVFLAGTGREICLLSGCFSMNAQELATFTQVGRLAPNQLGTTGKTGALFYGPYYRLSAGRYLVIVRGTFVAVPEATLDVITSSPNTAITGRLPLCAYDPQGSTDIVIPFELTADAARLEVRLWVAPADELRVDGYEIVSAIDAARQPTPVGPCQ
jgi:hypothetical protein